MLHNEYFLSSEKNIDTAMTIHCSIIENNWPLAAGRVQGKVFSFFTNLDDN
jgi:hypothetical protein